MLLYRELLNGFGCSLDNQSNRSPAKIHRFAFLIPIDRFRRTGVGVCTTDDIAVSVLTTVTNSNAEKGWIIVDAGWMAMSSDRNTRGQAVDQFFGLVCDIDGTPYPDLVMLKANQEHGIIAARPGTAAVPPNLPIGTKLRILPNHACATSSKHDHYNVIKTGSRRPARRAGRGDPQRRRSVMTPI